MDVKGVQARGQGSLPHHPSSSRNLEKGFYQILMKTMEMDGKYERFFRRIDWGWMDVIGVQAGGQGKPPSPPLFPQHPWKEVLPIFDEQDGDGWQRWKIFGRIQLRIKGHHRCASTGSGGHHLDHPNHPSSPNNLEKRVYQNLMNKMEMNSRGE